MEKVELKNESPTCGNTVLPTVSLRDYFASQAMLAVMQETQEMRIGSFWDWCKQLMVSYLHFTFLTVKYVADALLSVRNGR